MKRRTLKFMVCAVVMVFTLAVTACGGSAGGADNDGLNVEEDVAEVKAEAESEADTEIEPEDEAQTENEVDAEEEANTDSDSEGMTLEKYFSDPEVKAEFESIFSEYESLGFAFSIDAIGDDLTMTLQFIDPDMVGDADAMGETLAERIEASSDQYESYVGMFDALVGGKGTCTLTVRYTDPDNNVLAEKIFEVD